MYPRKQLAWVSLDELTATLCGRFRPGHFRGVATVVLKLFGICRPHLAVFGLKDAQQFLILKRMSDDLNLGIDIVGHPTVREADGLAVSSRNNYLSQEERTQAVVLSRAVRMAERLISDGETDSESVLQSMRDVVATASLARLQYAEIVDTETVQPIDRIRPSQRLLAALAVYFGETRLIDNAFIDVVAHAPESDSNHSSRT
jgi:pantoate--beta-alanine ligase